MFLGTWFIDIAYHTYLKYTFKEQVQSTWVSFVVLIWIQNL